MPRPRGRTAGLLMAVVLLFVLGTNVQAGWLFVLAAGLAATLVTGMLLPIRMVRGLVVERRASDEVHQGDELPVEVAVTNSSRGIRSGVLVTDPSFGAVTTAFPAIRPGERVEVVTMQHARRRGLAGMGPLTLRSSAPFGVAERRVTRDVRDPSPTLVLPVVIPLGPLAFARPAATTHQAIHTSRRRGSGPEYLGIREYRPGDPMRHVHWPSTARTDTLMVREFEEEQTHRLAIAIDASWDVESDPESWTPLDRVCAASASIALSALAQGHGTRLVLPGADGVEVMARADGSELLRRLALVTADRRFDLVDTLTELPGALQGVETLVLVFPARRGLDVAGLAGALDQLVAGIDTVVAIPVEVSAEEAKTECRPPGGWTTLEENLRGAGAEVYPWRSGDDLSALLAPDMSAPGVGATS